MPDRAPVFTCNLGAHVAVQIRLPLGTKEGKTNRRPRVQKYMRSCNLPHFLGLLGFLNSARSPKHVFEGCHRLHYDSVKRRLSLGKCKNLNSTKLDLELAELEL